MTNDKVDQKLNDFPLVELDEGVFTNPMNYVNRQMLLEGYYDNTAHVFIRNRKNLSKQYRASNSMPFSVNGYHVYTPFVLKDGRRVLINRGWISKKARMDPVRIKFDQIEGPIQVIGILVDSENVCINYSFRFSKFILCRQVFWIHCFVQLASIISGFMNLNTATLIWNCYPEN